MRPLVLPCLLGLTFFPGAGGQAAPRVFSPEPSPVLSVTSPLSCLRPDAALASAAAEIARGVQAGAAVERALGRLPGRFRYWDILPAQLQQTLQAACAQGFAVYGTAPRGGRLILLASLEMTAAVSPRVPAPASRVVFDPAPPPPELAQGTGEASTGEWPELLAGVNAVRAQGRSCGGVWKPPVPALTPDARLAAAARSHAAAMVRQKFVSHTNPYTGSTPQLRAQAQGFPGQASENMRYGTATPQGALSWWLGSAIHCANIMNPYWTHFGLGTQQASAANTYWVLMFGHLK